MNPRDCQLGSNVRPVKQAFAGFLFVCLLSFASQAHAQAQTPWQSNENGTLRTNINWNYTLGYNFTPQVDGQVTKLGGFFSGTKKVSLWQNGQLLATTNVTSSNSWSYVDITPVDVTAGVTYTVGAYLAGSGASYRYSITPFPQVYGDIQIENTTWVFGDGVPVSTTTGAMYGQADIEFVASCSVCGDGVCDPSEGFAVCPLDCPSPACGDGFCEAASPNTNFIDETGLNCGPDCAVSCGDGVCQNTEGHTLCQIDCPSPACGDGFCEAASPNTNFIDETGLNCQPDCTVSCGDGICQNTEGHTLCQIDCPSPACGDGFCEAASPNTNFIDETGLNCQPDCTVSCGNGICEVGEGHTACQIDCPSPACGDGFCESASPNTNFIDETGLNCQPDCTLTCGDGICQVNEGHTQCQIDCPSPACGDGFCEAASPNTNFIDETGLNCGPDCTQTCGDGICQVNEGHTQCQIDCPSPACGDGFCEAASPNTNFIDETGLNCGPDCTQTCGDGICQSGEGHTACQIDCPSPACGDGFCEAASPNTNFIDETGLNCQPDCPMSCGDGICQSNEQHTSCQIDCPSPACGDGFCEAASPNTNFIDETFLNCATDCPIICACVPDPVAVTCAGIQCGQVVNNCGDVVVCPDTCVLPQTCSGNTCS